MEGFKWDFGLELGDFEANMMVLAQRRKQFVLKTKKTLNRFQTTRTTTRENLTRNQSNNSKTNRIFYFLT